LLVAPVMVASVLATSYTGFLFAQGLGRDLWQGPSAAIDLIAQSAAAGAAALLVVAAIGGGPPRTGRLLGSVLCGALAAHLTILAFEHLLSPSPTRHHELATDTIRRGAYAPVFWWGAIVGGGIVPLVVLLTLGAAFNPVLTCTAALLAL